MFLPGNLRTTTLGDVLGQLHRGGVSGVLQIIACDSPRAGSSHEVTLVSGIVGDVSTSMPVPPIGEVLVEQGVLRPTEHRTFVGALSQGESILAGALLQQLGMVSEGTLRFGLDRQMRMRLDALYGIESGHLRFHPLHAKPPSAALPVRLGPREFLHGRPRARDRSRVPDRDQARQPGADGASRARKAASGLLGLCPTASRDQIRQAFRRAAVQVHPDLHAALPARERDAMQARFAELSRAYHLLILDDARQDDGAAAATA